MAKANGMSLAELEQLLNSRKSRLGDLKKKRTTLEKELTSIVNEIAVLEGPAPKGRGRAAGKKKVRRRRSKNAKPLRDVITDLLSNAKKGLALQEIHDGVLASGYKTASKNFKNVLYQCLYHTKSFVHDDKSGTYKVKS